MQLNARDKNKVNELLQQFDATFGPGAAASALGPTPSQAQ
jgi:hypothetical protein